LNNDRLKDNSFSYQDCIGDEISRNDSQENSSSVIINNNNNNNINNQINPNGIELEEKQSSKENEFNHNQDHTNMIDNNSKFPPTNQNTFLPNFNFVIMPQLHFPLADYEMIISNYFPKDENKLRNAPNNLDLQTREQIDSYVDIDVSSAPKNIEDLKFIMMQIFKNQELIRTKFLSFNIEN